MTKTSDIVADIKAAQRRRTRQRSLAVGAAQSALPVTRRSLLTAKQLEALALLAKPQRHTLLVGGSRSGKTFLLVRAVITRALKAPGSRHVIFRFRYNALKASVWLDTFPKVIKTCWPGLWELVENRRQDGFAKFPNGSEIWFCGLDEKERVEKVLGMEFATVMFNECSQIPFASVLLALTRLAQKCEGLRNRAYYDLNPIGTGHWTYVQFVEHKDPITKQPLLDPENYALLYMNPLDNAAHVDADYMASLQAMPERQRRRFFEGRYVAEIDGALWTLEQIERTRCHLDDVPKDLDRITVNVDPSGCAGEEDVRSDEIGITVTARKDGKRGDLSTGYLLADLSGRYSPEQWGRLVARAYSEWNADAVIGEQNFGGDMVRATVHAANRNLKFKMVTATRGKVIRAEPISAIYEQGRIMHAGKFSVLEDQLTNFSTSGYKGDRSPDRADSMIWGFHELMITQPTTGLLELIRKQQEAAR